jgi:phosphohistidine phosphatase SixA
MIAKRRLGKPVVCLLSALLVYACTAQPALVISAPSRMPVPFHTPTLTAVPAIAMGATPTPASMGSLWGAALIEALRQGGYVIYLRHTAHDRSQADTGLKNLKNCRSQSNLTDAGRADARAIGKAFLALGIPVGQVFSSEFCRVRDTALLAFGQMETSADLTEFPAELREQRAAALRRMISTPPQPGTNTVLVGHDAGIRNAASISLAEGEAVIFAPSGADGFTPVARILPKEWAVLEQLAGGLVPDHPALAANFLLPDLQTRRPSGFFIRANSSTGQKMLRFTNSVINNGPGPVELWSDSNRAAEKAIVVQHIYNVDGPVKKAVVGEFIFHPAHAHWHLGNFSRYEIWSLKDGSALDALVALSDKVSYCLRDDARAQIAGAVLRQTYISCNQNRQGISVGWVDIYSYYLKGQSVDITDLPDGIYAMRSVVNPDNQLWESDYSNNAAVVYIEIRGNGVSVVDDIQP